MMSHWAAGRTIGAERRAAASRLADFAGNSSGSGSCLRRQRCTGLRGESMAAGQVK